MSQPPQRWGRTAATRMGTERPPVQPPSHPLLPNHLDRPPAIAVVGFSIDDMVGRCALRDQLAEEPRLRKERTAVPPFPLQDPSVKGSLE